MCHECYDEHTIDGVFSSWGKKNAAVLDINNNGESS